jgi:hypothetical protein
MFIQIFTKTEKQENGLYKFYHNHYLDGVKLESKFLEWKADSDYLADAINIGFAMRENIEADRKFGIVFREFNFISVYKGLKAGYSPQTWTEYKSGVRRNVTVYTTNKELYRDIITGFTVADSLTTRTLLRIVKLKTDFGIGVGLLSEQEINADYQANWARKYD